MTAQQWLEAFATNLGGDAPDPAVSDQILKLAAVAAHASERIAAPIACYMAGATGKPLPEAIAVAEEIAGEEG